MRHAAALGRARPHNSTSTPRSAPSPPAQDAFIRGASFERPTMVFDLDALQGQVRRARRGARRRRHPLRGQGEPGARGGVGDRRASAGASTPPRAARSTSASGSGCRRATSPSATPSSAPPTSRTRIASGVEQFAADAEEEIVKLAEHAPGARVIVRMLIEASEADWPLSRKFGCSPREALRLMDLGRRLGLDMAGISFHAGSQMREPAMWRTALDAAARALDRGEERRALVAHPQHRRRLSGLLRPAASLAPAITPPR